MMMRGDMQKIIDQVNPVFETAFNRIEALDVRVKELEAQIEALTKDQKRPVGRPRKNPEGASEKDAA